MIGQRIGGRYETIRLIGDGGMSKVYLAHDVILDRDVAIKVLNYDFANEEELKRRFQREALSATSLTHPHIVNIFDVGEEDELHYLVMEYIEGQTLKKFIQTNGPLRPEEAVPIMQQLVSAIANAHVNGIIHRDIKPQNILMDAHGNVKITDFGIAMALTATAHTKTNSVLGTVHYLSPEQARGGMATKKSDIYSLGIVFYELLTGELPFSAESAVAIALKHLQEETPSVREKFPTIPQSVENVILKATAKDAHYRYQSAEEMYDDLRTVLLPERAHEEKFTLPFDDDRTLAIPVINKLPNFESSEETKRIEPVVSEPQKKQKKKRKKWPFFVGGVIFVILLITVLALSGLFGSRQIVMPNVIGWDETEATEKIEEEGFVVDERIEEPNDEYEPGQVFKTTPEAGKKRDAKTLVTIYISTGKEKMELQDYTTRDYTSTKNLLAGWNFKSIEPDEEYSDEPAGTILGQTPEAGEMVIPEETDLIFRVSKGPELITLDDLSGYSKADLNRYEKSTGLTINIEREEFSSVEKGKVVSQSPRAGAEMSKGETVRVVLSKGVEKKPVKHVVHTVTIPYVPASTGSEGEDEEDGHQELIPQEVKVYVQDRKRSMGDPDETFTITEDRTIRITIELEDGQRGGYRIFRDGVVVAEKMFNYKDIQ